MPFAKKKRLCSGKIFSPAKKKYNSSGMLGMYIFHVCEPVHAALTLAVMNNKAIKYTLYICPRRCSNEFNATFPLSECQQKSAIFTCIQYTQNRLYCGFGSLGTTHIGKTRRSKIISL